MRHSVKLIVTLVGALSGQAAWADIYTFVDERGVRHFSNVPQDARYRFYMREPGGDHPPAEAPRLSMRGAPRISPEKIAAYALQIEQAARLYRLDPRLIHAVIHTESAYNPRAVSRKGAQGLMQLMPDTARRYGVANAFDPTENIGAGARYLRDLLDLFAQDLNLALAAFNAGEAAVARFGNQIPPYAETRAYVPLVLARYAALKRSGSQSS